MRLGIILLAGAVAVGLAGIAHAQINPNQPNVPPGKSIPSNSDSQQAKPRGRAPGYPSVYQQQLPPPGNPSPNNSPPIGALPQAPPPSVNIFAPNYEPMGPRRLGQERARDAVRHGEIMSLGQVMPYVRQRVPGRVMDVNLQGVIYSIRMLTPRGTVVLVEADGRTGRVLNVHGRY